MKSDPIAPKWQVEVFTISLLRDVALAGLRPRAELQGGIQGEQLHRAVEEVASRLKVRAEAPSCGAIHVILHVEEVLGPGLPVIQEAAEPAGQEHGIHIHFRGVAVMPRVAKQSFKAFGPVVRGVAHVLPQGPEGGSSGSTASHKLA